MNTDKHGLKCKDLTQKIIGVFYEVYNELGHGFIESVYQNALVLTLRSARPQGLHPDRNTGLVSRRKGGSVPS